jgi:hypothetical protein
MSIIGSNILAGASGQAGGGGAYEVERSVRFNSSDSAYLGATFGTPTDQDVFTLSMWVKRSALGSTQHLFGVSTNHSFGFTSGDALNLTFGGSSALTTTALFRDPSAWYHIMWVQNGTAHTLYVNGTSAGTATATSNTFNTAVAHQISAGNTADFFNGYLAEYFFIDGQALTPSSFGEFDTNGVWQPKAYTGTYGTNGFRLPFSDNSTAAALGTDTSSNGNTWTVNNISVTAGAGNDSLVDSPTNGSQTDTGVGGEVRGNYATLNPNMTRDFYITYSNGNLDFTQAAATGGAQQMSTQATIGVASGKWYWEVTKVSTDNTLIGVAVSMDANADAAPSAGYIYYNKDGSFGGSGFTSPSSGASTTVGDVIGVALDADNRTVQFFKNGASQGTATNGPTGQTWFPSTGVWTSSDPGGATYNFGQRPFAYTAPSGFKALCTTNLPTGSITTSGSFTGNADADGPFVYLNGVPTAMTINSNAVTFATHADKLSNGFKLRTSSGSYNTAGSNTYSITTTGAEFKFARAQPNP